MPIRINLLAEAQAAEDLRRRDPVKRAIWIGGFFICVTLLFCGKLQFDIWREGSTRSRLERDWATQEPKYKALLTMRERADRLNSMADALNRYSTNRFLWANVFNALQHSLVTDIQLTRIRGEHTYEFAKGETITNTTATGTSVIHKPAAATEKIRLVLDARDFDNQDQNWTKYKESLTKYDFFKRHLSHDSGFVLDGTQGAPQRDPLDPGHEYVSFSLVAKFPEVKRYE